MKPRTFRPHFSVRTMAIFVTLVCAYFACWEATKRHAKKLGGLKSQISDELQVKIVRASSSAPLVIREELGWSYWPRGIGEGGVFPDRSVRYSVWLFGPKFAIPFVGTNPGPLPSEDEIRSVDPTYRALELKPLDLDELRFQDLNRSKSIDAGMKADEWQRRRNKVSTS
jgi:hypothetical protein